MKYGLLEYYHDELNQWFRIAEFQHEVLGELMRQMNLILTFPVVSLPDLKSASSLSDRLAKQELRANYLLTRIPMQRRLIKESATVQTHESLILEQQKILRAKMMRNEKSFVKISCDSTTFLSSFFELIQAPEVTA
jgi:hypothetical protein